MRAPALRVGSGVNCGHGAIRGQPKRGASLSWKIYYGRTIRSRGEVRPVQHSVDLAGKAALILRKIVLRETGSMELAGFSFPPGCACGSARGAHRRSLSWFVGGLEHRNSRQMKSSADLQRCSVETVRRIEIRPPVCAGVPLMQRSAGMRPTPS